MTRKQESLPKDIEWHMIGHVQSNKVKYMAPYVNLIHGVDREKLLKIPIPSMLLMTGKAASSIASNKTT